MRLSAEARGDLGRFTTHPAKLHLDVNVVCERIMIEYLNVQRPEFACRLQNVEAMQK